MIKRTLAKSIKQRALTGALGGICLICSFLFFFNKSNSHMQASLKVPPHAALNILPVRRKMKKKKYS